VVSPAQTIVFDDLSRPNIVVTTLGGGRILVSGNEVMGDYNLSAGDTRLFSNQVFDWLLTSGIVALSPSLGNIAPGDSQHVNVKIKTESVDGGTYHRYIHIANNDPGHRDLVVPVDIRVIGRPELVLRADTVNFGTVYIGYPDTMTLRINNNGSDTLHVSSVASDQPQFSTIDPVPFVVTAHAFRNIRLRFIPDAPIAESGILSISSDDLHHPTVSVHLLGAGLHPPVIGVTPDSLDFTLYQGDSTAATLNITNSGLGNLTFLIKPSESPSAVAKQASSSSRLE
jgi:hypothetical protein